jgi:hypothetical protein
VTAFAPASLRSWFVFGDLSSLVIRTWVIMALAYSPSVPFLFAT